MNGEQKIRFKQKLKPLLAVVFVGICYYFWILVTGLKIPCIFNELTGFLCPGCGITRMFMALFRLDFKTAFGYNQAMFFILPVFSAVYLFETYRFIKTGTEKNTLLSELVMAGCGIGLLVFGIIRNI